MGSSGHPSLSWPLVGWFWPLLATTLTPLLFSTGKVGSEMLQVKDWRSGDRHPVTLSEKAAATWKGEVTQ